MSKKTPAAGERPHSQAWVKVVLSRRCSFPGCHKRIKYLPSDVDPRYARFCMECRVHKIPEMERYNV
jgi:hypothetical protein